MRKIWRGERIAGVSGSGQMTELRYDKTRPLYQLLLARSTIPDLSNLY